MRFALYHIDEELCIDHTGAWCDPDDPDLEGVLSGGRSIDLIDTVEIATGNKFSEIFKNIILLNVSDLDFEYPMWDGAEYEVAADARWGLLKAVRDLHSKYGSATIWTTGTGSDKFYIECLNTTSASS